MSNSSEWGDNLYKPEGPGGIDTGRFSITNPNRGKIPVSPSADPTPDDDRSGSNRESLDADTWETGRSAWQTLGFKPYKFNPPLHPSIRPSVDHSIPFRVPGKKGPEDTRPELYGKGDVKTTWKLGKSRDAKKWRLGQLIGDLTATVYGDDDEYRYGFRFLYNPVSLSVTSVLNENIPPDMVNDGGNFIPIVSGGMATISMEILLNRIPEVSGPAKYGDTAGVEDETAKALNNSGTLLDLDYLFRTQNGVHTTIDRYGKIHILSPDSDVEAAKKEILGANYREPGTTGSGEDTGPKWASDQNLYADRLYSKFLWDLGENKRHWFRNIPEDDYTRQNLGEGYLNRELEPGNETRENMISYPYHVRPTFGNWTVLSPDKRFEYWENWYSTKSWNGGEDAPGDIPDWFGTNYKDPKSSGRDPKTGEPEENTSPEKELDKVPKPEQGDPKPPPSTRKDGDKDKDEDEDEKGSTSRDAAESDDQTSWDLTLPIDVRQFQSDSGDIILEEVWGRRTGDLGMLMANPIWLTLGPSMHWYGWLTNIAYSHIMFSRDMTPMLTKVNLSFQRIFSGTPDDSKRLRSSAVKASFLQGNIYEPRVEDKEGDGGGASGGKYPADHRLKEWEKDILRSGNSEEALKNNIAAIRALAAEFPKAGINNAYRDSDPYPDHPSGLALDIGPLGGDLGIYNQKPEAVEEAGDAIAKFFYQNSDRFAMGYQIWKQRSRGAGGDWTRMDDRGGATANHMDHVHILFHPYAKLTGNPTSGNYADIKKGTYWDEESSSGGGGGSSYGGDFHQPTGSTMPTSGGNGGQGASRGYTGGHSGEDFAISRGTKLYAFASGTVTFVNKNNPPSSLDCIIVDSGNFKWKYQHMAAISVSEGDEVEAGDSVGKSGPASGATGTYYDPHLHMDVFSSQYKDVYDGTSKIGGGNSASGKSTSLKGHNKDWFCVLEVFRAVDLKVNTSSRNGMTPVYKTSNLNEVRNKLGISSSSDNSSDSASFRKMNSGLLVPERVRLDLKDQTTAWFSDDDGLHMGSVETWVGDATSFLPGKPDLYCKIRNRYWVERGSVPRSPMDAVRHLVTYLELPSPDQNWSMDGLGMVARAYGLPRPTDTSSSAKEVFRWAAKNSPHLVVSSFQNTGFGQSVPIGAVLYWDSGSGSTGYGRVGIAAGYRNNVLMYFSTSDKGSTIELKAAPRMGVLGWTAPLFPVAWGGRAYNLWEAPNG